MDTLHSTPVSPSGDGSDEGTGTAGSSERNPPTNVALCSFEQENARLVRCLSGATADTLPSIIDDLLITADALPLGGGNARERWCGSMLGLADEPIPLVVIGASMARVRDRNGGQTLPRWMRALLNACAQEQEADLYEVEACFFRRGEGETLRHYVKMGGKQEFWIGHTQTFGEGAYFPRAGDLVVLGTDAAAFACILPAASRAAARPVSPRLDYNPFHPGARYRATPSAYRAPKPLAR